MRRWLKRPQTPEPAYLDELADFSGDVDRLSEGDLLLLRGVWEGAVGEGRESALAGAEAALATSGRTQVAEDLKFGLVRWSENSGHPISTRAYLQPPGLAIEIDLRRRALPVVYEVGLAVLLADVLSPEAFDTLYGPWRALSEDAEARAGGAEDGGEEG
ncbi:MAG: hypothetical protein QOH61_468 [Chloroflexota bacterium]|nr:hypothetical protein [Chloroflexota bacterium]